MCIFNRDIKVKAPYDIKEDRGEVHHTYLDTVGRPVIVMKKSNVVENHIQDIEVGAVLFCLFVLH